MATSTILSKPRLVYALPTVPPIPFAARPTYPIRLPTRDLGEAYTATLWPGAEQSASQGLASLEAFARLLVSLLHDKSPADFNVLIRQHVLPLQSFDKRWRSEIPAILDEDGKPNSTIDSDTTRITDEYRKWSIAERRRLEEERKKRAKKGKERAIEQLHIESGQGGRDQDDEEGEEGPLEVRPDKWIEAKELLETRLQALLLLGLLSLPVTFQPERPKKGKKKRTPELFAETLDPAMLLDFQTDRLQIWRVMQDVSELNVAAIVAGEQATAKEKEMKQIVEQRDVVQDWWADVVEPSFRTRVDAATLSHHRIKLFPASTSQADRLAQRLAPAPSPFKTRSLLSLEKSARKREAKAGEQRVAESPTMKRLLKGASSASGHAGGDVFKVPSSRTGRRVQQEATASDTSSQIQQSVAAKPRSSLQAERSRPLPRGDSTAGATEVLQRRVVNFNKKPKAKPATATAAAAKAPRSAMGTLVLPEDEPMAEITMRKRKRKSFSPKKLEPFERSSRELVLAPDTPVKDPAVGSASFRNPFSRAPTVPSFAALGAAFRAGPAQSDDLFAPFRLPTPTPPLEAQAGSPSDWRSFSMETGGRDRSDPGDPSTRGADEARTVSTPKRPSRMLVPDT
ncbi:hypothetical protein JCM10908_001573 [Rhodotorula pacifica]|uniref:uncharacterized protein n=1 Tax=Rhodotorula pacifica TaxID=1495444 RepID=UPI00317D8917